MRVDEIRDRNRRLDEFDEGLHVGQEVVVRWTNSGYGYRAKATVSKVNRQSVRVRLHSHVPTPWGGQGYPAGWEITVPRWHFGGDPRWSPNNGVFATMSGAYRRRSTHAAAPHRHKHGR